HPEPAEDEDAHRSDHPEGERRPEPAYDGRRRRGDGSLVHGRAPLPELGIPTVSGPPRGRGTATRIDRPLSARRARAGLIDGFNQFPLIDLFYQPHRDSSLVGTNRRAYLLGL